MSFLRILQVLVLTTSSFLQSADSLSGKHVCTRIKNHTLAVKEAYTEPVIVQTFTWCLQVPPRCSKTRVENRERYRIKTTVEERKISECCDGYVIQKSYGDSDEESECVPFCTKTCGKNGICIKPNVCECESGYLGDNCAHECPPGSWGRDCMEICDCASGRSCNPVTGICECPKGWEGVGCKLPCAEGRWGSRCESICECNGDRTASCDPVTGECYFGRKPNAEEDLPNYSTVRVSGLLLASTSTASATSQTRKSNEGTETSVTGIDHDPRTTGSKDFSADTRFSKTTEPAQDEESQTITERPEESDAVKRGFPSPDSVGSRSTTSHNELARFEDNISQTVPETRRKITPILPEGTFYTNNEDTGEDSGVNRVGAPHPSYVKTVQKEQAPQIPYDTTVLIVVGSVVSLCITTLAALMVFYLRSKMFESIPLSIYNNDKNEVDQEKGSTIRSLNITSTALPPLPTFVNPVFAANTENALITFDAAELNKHYDNRTGTISIRVSRNMRDLLESHYDRPPTATCRHTVDQNAEHVYDEIPLTVPLCVRKEA